MDLAAVAPVFTLVGSLAGVALGGRLALRNQRANQVADRELEKMRLDTQRVEARRAERLEAIEKFLISAQDAERLASDHHRNGADGTEWQSASDRAMDRVWVALKLLGVLCGDETQQAAEGYAGKLHEGTWQKPADIELWHFLEPSRKRFLQAAAAEIDSSE
ncbi:hypothetical protein [Nocardia xishanensis]|uniref:hypothetical protein n=1 Tax=Nocardia xishanensis TaxID=238964 RepID=UPI0034299EE5